MLLIKILKSPFVFVKDLILLVLIYLPGQSGVWLRRQYYRMRCKSFGKNIVIEPGVFIESPQLISFGNDVHIDKNCILTTGTTLTGKNTSKKNADFKLSQGELKIGNHVHLVQNVFISAYGGVEIGDHCTLSAGSRIYSYTNLAYDPDDRSKVVSIMPYKTANFLIGPVVLKENVWLGLQTIVMPGVTINENSFTTSNSVVTKSFPNNSYLSGSPAQKIRSRFTES